MSTQTSLRGAPPISGKPDKKPSTEGSFIKDENKDKYMEGSIWKKKDEHIDKKYPLDVILTQDTVFSGNFAVLIHFKEYKDSRPVGNIYNMIPDVFNEYYEFIRKKESNVLHLPSIVKQGGSRSTGKTIQYLGKSRTVYVGSKGGKFIYTDAFHKNKKYIK